MSRRLRACALAALLAGAATSAAAATLDPRRGATFARICAHCHANPTLAPVPGDAEAWRERNAAGFDVLLRHTVEGYRNMPPLGTCGHCSEADLRALVSFMSGLPDPARAKTTP